MTWPAIESLSQPVTAADGREGLKRDVSELGLKSIPAMIRTWAIVQPSKGSFAGSLWALYEWADWVTNPSPERAGDSRPPEPSIGLLMSMAIRSDHAIGCPGYYDEPLVGGKPGMHARRVEIAISGMRKLYEEMTGSGFYKPEKEAEYRAMYHAASQLTMEIPMTEQQIKYMVDRFLGWHLPKNWQPDGGISFEPLGNKGTPHQYVRHPVGTNLFDAQQAETMVRYMIEGL